MQATRVKMRSEAMGQISDDSLRIVSEDLEVSFAVNLFPGGFSVGKPTEKGKTSPAAFEVMDLMYPYNRTSESFLRALDGGWIPGDLLEDIPCKYDNGCVACELRDYRDGVPSSLADMGSHLWSKACIDWMPVVHKIVLRPSTETIVKDVLSMVDETWTYNDLLEVESRILKAVCPDLYLDPKSPFAGDYSRKLNSGHNIIKRYRAHKGDFIDRRLHLIAAAKATVKANSLVNSKKISFEKVNEMFVGAPASEIVSTTQEVSALAADKLQIASGPHSLQEAGKHEVSAVSHSVALQASGTSLRGLQIPTTLDIPSTQFPSSPISSVSGTLITPTGHDVGFRTDSRLVISSSLGKRDLREPSGVPMDMKKPRQEEPKIERFQPHQYIGMQKVDCRLPNDQRNKEKHDLHSQHTLGEGIQPDVHSTNQLNNQNMSDVRVKQEPEFEKKISGSEQQGVAERAKEELKTIEADSDQQPQGQQQLASQRFLQQSFGQSQSSQVQQLQALGQLIDKARKADDSLQKMQLSPSTKVLKKTDTRSSIFSPVGSKSNDTAMAVSPPYASGTAVTAVTSAVVSSSDIHTAAHPMQSMPSLGQPIEKSQMQHSPLAGLDSIMQIQQSQSSNSQLSKQRMNSFPKTATTASGVASPGSVTNASIVANVNSPTGSTSITVSGVKSEEQLENLLTLISIAQRHELPAKRSKVEELPDIVKSPPSWQLLSVALANTSTDDYKEPKGQRSMAHSLVGGNVNLRKTRYLQFQRTEQLFQGNGHPPIVRRIRVRLVMCERSKDSVVEAVVQFGDDQDDESLNSVPHHVLPMMANVYAADLFAMQFCALLEKDGFELVDDQVHPSMPRGSVPLSATSVARPLSANASTLGSNFGQLSSPRVVMNQHMPGMNAVCGISGLNPMQPSSPSVLAAGRMPPPGNAPSRQLSTGYLGSAGVATSSKPLQLDGAAVQLASVQHQIQQHQQPQIQRAQQFVTATQLAQLNASGHNAGQQINQQMVASQSQLQQLQLLQQRQQQPSAVLSRKMMLPGSMGSLGAMGNMSGLNNMNSVNSAGGVGIPVSGGTQGNMPNMVGLSGINSIVGMASMNNVSASIGGISGLANVGQLSSIGAIGQSTGLGNIIGQQLRPGTGPTMNMAAFSKLRMSQGRGVRPSGTASSPVRNPIENLSGMNTTNQAHSSAGLPMMGQPLARSGLTQMQRTAAGTMGPPKVASSGIATVGGQNYYLNPQQLTQQQQLNLQQQLNPQQLNMQQSSNAQTQLSQQQLMGSQMQPNPQQQQQPNLQQSLTTQQQQLNPQQQIISQSHINQQLNSPPQLNPSLQTNVQHGGGLGSRAPASPQLSSQTLGSVVNITSSSMDLQITNRAGSLGSSGQ